MQKFVIPSTSPTFVSSVMSTTMSLGGTICANWGLVSMLPSLGLRSMTFDQASRRLPRILTMMPSMTESSMSVSSRLIFDASPGPPKSLSMIVKVIDGSISRIELPFERVHVDHGQGGRVGDRAEEFLVGELVHGSDVHVNDRPELGRKRGGGEAGEGLVHHLEGAYLVLGELVRAPEVVDLDLPRLGLPEGLFPLDLAG